MLRNIFLQIGATRDGLNPYASVAQKFNYYKVLVESPDFINFQSASVNYDFDYILRVRDPANAAEVMAAYQAIGIPKAPTIVLPGFEIYNKSSYQIRALLQENESAEFLPLDKAEQRRAFSGSVHAQPWFNYYKCLDDIPKHIPSKFYPCIIKPVDSGGGLGVWLISSDRELKCALWELKQTKNYGGSCFSGFLVEQYLEGDEFSLQGVVSGNKSHALACCKKIIERDAISGDPRGFRESGHVAFSSTCIPQSFKTLMEFCCKRFGYNEGAFHIDFIVVDDIIYFIEMGFRMSGMGISSIVDYVSGKSWSKISFQIAEGKHFDDVALDNDCRASGQLRIRTFRQLRAAEHFIQKARNGTITYRDPETRTALHMPCLDADLSRHSGILGTLELRGKYHDRILEDFISIITSDEL